MYNDTDNEGYYSDTIHPDGDQDGNHDLVGDEPPAKKQKIYDVVAIKSVFKSAADNLKVKRMWMKRYQTISLIW